MNLNIFLLLLLWRFALTTACQSRIKSPVLELRPLPKDERGTLIHVTSSHSISTNYWVEELNSFLKPYLAAEKPDTWVGCRWNQPPPKDKVCEARVEPSFAPCLPKYNYGYDRGTPCIFLTFTQVPKGWSPVYYNSTGLPAEMPELLKTNVREGERRENHQKVWVYCEGENPADEENIGPIQYFPEIGFPANSFLNSQVRGYFSPVMALLFENPARGVVIMVRCTAWAKNIPRNPEDKIGSVHFELMVD